MTTATTTYKLRSDKTVVKVDPTGVITAFQAAGGGGVKAVGVKAENAVAVFDMSAPGGLMIEYGTEANIVNSMLNGITPKDTHGFLGFLGGVVGGGWLGAAGMLPFGGVLGALIGAVAGERLGAYIKTKVPGVQMTPIVQVTK